MSVLNKAITEFIGQVRPKPDEFERHLGKLLKTANNWMDEKDTPRAVAQKLVEESLEHADFLYNGVRLCVHLAKDITDSTQRVLFREALIKYCQDRISTVIDQDAPGTPQAEAEPLAMFVGDLYSRNIIDGDSQGDDQLGFSLLRLLTDSLLRHLSDRRLKVCAQLIKLCGPKFSDAEERNAVEQPLMQFIIERMSYYCDDKEAQEQVQISPITRDLMKSVVTYWSPIPLPIPTPTSTDPEGELTDQDYERMRYFEECYNQLGGDEQAQLQEPQMDHYVQFPNNDNNQPQQQHQQQQEQHEPQQHQRLQQPHEPPYHSREQYQYQYQQDQDQYDPGYAYVEDERGQRILLGPSMNPVQHSNDHSSAAGQYDFGNCDDQDDDDVAEEYERFLRETGQS